MLCSLKWPKIFFKRSGADGKIANKLNKFLWEKYKEAKKKKSEEKKNFCTPKNLQTFIETKWIQVTINVTLIS